MSASVKKKFQCTPYSVTCSWSRQLTLLRRSRCAKLTGYSTPLTMTTRTTPSAITGNDFLTFRNRNLGKDMSWWNDRVEMMPREKTNEPTPISICPSQPLCCPVPFEADGDLRAQHTKLVPKVSVLPSHRGKIGKSTAKIECTVMTIICALYTDKNGSLSLPSFLSCA